MTKTILSLCLFICLVSTGCHKDDDPKPECKITTLSSSDGSEDNLTYNSNGKIAASTSTATSSTTINSYTYSDNTTAIASKEDGQFSFKAVATMNSDGLATNVRTEWDESGTTWTNDSYEYNGTEVIKETETSSFGSSASITTFTWENGNMVTSTSDNETTTYAYYTDKTSGNGDYFHLITLTNGYEIFRTKNRLKSVTADSSPATLTYTTDTDGKITALTVSQDGTTYIINYQYQCN